MESDHKPLQNIEHRSLANTPPRLQRMMLRIQPYKCSIKYKPGSEMVFADALSRLNQRIKIDLDQTIHMAHCQHRIPICNNFYSYLKQTFALEKYTAKTTNKYEFFLGKWNVIFHDLKN